jgi:flagellar motor switch protein FliM
MPANDILSQDEIDALLTGVESGAVKTENEYFSRDGVARNYDLASQDRIIRGRMPTLEMINQRFARHFRISLFNLLRRSPEIAVSEVRMSKFSEYVHGLFVPASLNLTRLKPLRGTALVVFDPKLVFALVNNFFGGEARFHAKIEGREFTATEQRIVQMALQHAYRDLKEAWAPVVKLEPEFVNTEVNPHFANIVTPTEVVVVSSFHVDLEGAGGDLHLTMPYSMIEPIRDVLDAGLQSDRDEMDERWTATLRQDVMAAEVEVSSTLAETRLMLRELMELKPGDVIPIELPSQVVLKAEGLPLFRGQYGASRGNHAVKVREMITLRPPGGRA